MSKSSLLLLTLFIVNISFPLLAVEPKGESQILKAFCDFENANFERHMNPYFLSKLPKEKLIGILKGFEKQEGPCVTIEKVDQNNFLYTTVKSQRAMQLYLDKNQKIRGLWFGNATSFSDKLSIIIDELKKLPGKTSLSYIKNGKTELLSYNADLALAVGSSSALYLLQLLDNKVRKTKLNWNSNIKLKQSNKGIPGGRLYSWPNGSPVTIQTLATMLMAYSDETASDHLFSLVRRKSLEQKSKKNRPYLSTLEYHKLRSEKTLKYKEQSLKEKRLSLKKIGKTPWEKMQFIDTPFEMDSIGWFFSTKELCKSIFDLRKAPFASVNPGIAQRRGWDFASFKMGRAPGVLQYTQLVRPKGSKDHYCVSITWNNPKGEIEPSKVDNLLSRILSKIK